MNKISISILSAGTLPTNLRKEISLGTLRVADGPIPAHLSLFRILHQDDGDKRIVWDSMNLSEIIDAKQMFNELIEAGMTPYRVDLSGKRTPEVMTTFDPTAEELVMSERREIVFAPTRAVAGG